MKKEEGSIVFSDWGMVSSTDITDAIAEIVISYRRTNGTGFGMFPEIALGNALDTKAITIYITFGDLVGSFEVTKKEAMHALRSRNAFLNAVKNKVVAELRSFETLRREK